MSVGLIKGFRATLTEDPVITIRLLLIASFLSFWFP